MKYFDFRNRSIHAVVLMLGLVVTACMGGMLRRGAAQEVLWQIERERIDDAIASGDYDSAVELAESFRKTFMNSRGKSTPKTVDTVERDIVVRGLLADTRRVAGSYDKARDQYQSALELSKDVRQRLVFAFYKTGQVRGALNQLFLSAIDNGSFRGAVNAAAAENQAADAGRNLFARICNLEVFRASLLDGIGSLELDNGNLVAAERYFRESAAIREQFGDIKKLGGPHATVYATAARNFGRLYLKQGEQALEKGNMSEASDLFQRSHKFLQESLDSLLEAAPVTVVAGNASSTRPRMLGLADIYFNFAELEMSSAAVSVETGATTEAMLLLSSAERKLIKAADVIATSLDRSHPYIAYCWINLAGIGARRCLWGAGGTSTEMASYRADAAEYRKRAEEVVRRRISAATNHVHLHIAREAAVVDKVIRSEMP